MSDMGCPFGAYPQCADCDGLCWQQPSDGAQFPPEPQPCEGCYYITGQMMECCGLCDGLAAENLEQRRAEYAVRAES